MLIQKVIQHSKASFVGHDWTMRLSSKEEECHWKEAKALLDEQRRAVEQKGLDWQAMKQKVTAALERLELERSSYRKSEASFTGSAQQLKDRLNQLRERAAE